MRSKEATLYRPILKKAWRTAWRHKRLWFFGILAGLANTGSIVDIAFRAFKRSATEDGAHALLSGSTPGATSFLEYAQTLALVSPTRVQVTVTIIILAILLLVFLGVSGQIGLVKAIPLADKNKRGWHLFGHPLADITHVFILDVLSRVAMIALSLLVASLVLNLNTGSVGGDAIVYFAVLLFFVPLALMVGYLSVFTVIEVAAKGKNVGQAIKASWSVLVRHWLPITEVAIALFFLNLLVSGLLVGAILLYSVPYFLLLTGATLTGSGILWITVIILGTALLFALILAFFGFLTTFTYAAWYHTYEKFGKRTTIRSKIERVVRHLSIIRGR